MRQRLLAAFLVVSLALAALPAGVSAGVATDATATQTQVECSFPFSATDATATQTQVECSFPFSATDATGTEVTVTDEPQRVTVLAPSAAQTMWEIGAEEKVVGAPVNQYSTYLEGIENKTNVAAAGSQEWVDNEKVVNTSPDLVLAPNVISNDTVDKLRDAGLTVYKFEEAESLDDIYAKTLLTGQLVGACDGAEETVSWMKDRISTVREAVEEGGTERLLQPRCRVDRRTEHLHRPRHRDRRWRQHRRRRQQQAVLQDQRRGRHRAEPPLDRREREVRRLPEEPGLQLHLRGPERPGLHGEPQLHEPGRSARRLPHRDDGQALPPRGVEAGERDDHGDRDD
ncbi:ABC transporter substrate-binding protein [Halospeciosus flavus]|uniref:ABC transporter substrate-binding protein n=1 Tax=Halospeciosus flavus TaxID=3032283 RepID=UPI00360D39EA